MFDNSSVIQASADDKTFLGYIKIDVATTHKDTEGDVLTKTFIEKTVSDLLLNRSYFKNHNTLEDPIGSIVDGEVFQLDDGHHSARMTVGFSKTAVKEWTLVQEGILNKASIGFYPDWDTMHYDEKSDTLFITDGYVIEASSVGVPANPNASLVDTFKSLEKSSRKMKSYVKNKVLNKSNEDISMNEDDLKSLFDGFEKRIDEKIKNIQVPEKTEEPQKDNSEQLIKLFESKLSEKEEEFKKALEASEKRAMEFEEEIKKLKEAGGRKSASNKNVDKDVHFLNDEKTALKKGFYEIGKVIKSGQPFEIKLIPSLESDAFGG